MVVILFIGVPVLIVLWLPSHSSKQMHTVLITKPSTVITTEQRSDPMSDLLKQDVYNYCKSFSKTNLLNITLNMTSMLSSIHIIVRFSPKIDDPNGLYLQIATSYIISQTLRQFSVAQQSQTQISLFLSEQYSEVMYNRLENWLQIIYQPYTNLTTIMRTEHDHQRSWKSIFTYLKFNQYISLDTILFLLEDDYVFESSMFSETIEFFHIYNPCFVLQTDSSEHCALQPNQNGKSFTLLNGRTRLWRSISTTTGTYACRLRSILAVDDIIIYSKNIFELRRKLNDQLGHTATFCAMPSYGSHLETLILPNGINITDGIEAEVYFKDWWSLARRAVSEAQKHEAFPAAQVNEKILFIE